MFSRVLGIPLLLGAAVAVPYVATNGPDLKSLMEKVSSLGASADKIGTPSVSASKGSQSSAGSLGSTQSNPGANQFATGSPSQRVPLQEVFRFDISKEWVYHRWTRKSTALSELGLFGIRVPLVTGTQPHDLAGSLTYFFGNDGRVHRISFRGRTGNTTQIVMLVARRHGLQQQPSAIVGEQLFQVRRDERVYSELRTRPASVLRNSTPLDSFLVTLELQRPDARFPLPIEIPEVVRAAQVGPAPADAAAAQDSAAKSGEEEKENPDLLETFFPRTRLSDGQIDNLDKNERLW